ncbi:MAG TPA: hypothetical protein VG759_27575 [Candidatus Angelobacter sp.]|nr:hypothetical protein [Candidatus Angelobacter sp.]
MKVARASIEPATVEFFKVREVRAIAQGVKRCPGLFVAIALQLPIYVYEDLLHAAVCAGQSNHGMRMDSEEKEPNGY